MDHVIHLLRYEDVTPGIAVFSESLWDCSGLAAFPFARFLPPGMLGITTEDPQPLPATSYV